MIAQSALLAAFLAGLLGGLHCAAMCGGWVAATTSPMSAPLLPARTLALHRGLQHLGRLATYTAIGGALGAGGGAAFALALAPAQHVVYVVANVALVGLAISIARRAPAAPAVLERWGLGVFARLAPIVRQLDRRAVIGPIATGALWGLTPCALIYGLLPIALLSGSAASGATIMLAFGLGTLPNLLAAQASVVRMRRVGTRTAWRMAGALMVAAFGAAGIYRGLFLPDAFASGVYCLVPFGLHGTLATVPH